MFFAISLAMKRRHYTHTHTHIYIYIYTLDTERKKRIVIDTNLIPKYVLDVPYKHYAIPIVGFRLYF
jgi:hypothetical protein